MQDKGQEKGTVELEVNNYLAKGDKFVFYLFKKVSKISYAVYAITDLIKDTEPLKWTLRKTATDMSSLRNFFDEKSVFNNLERTLLELESSLELASFAKVVSFMNAQLLQNEIRKIVQEMRERAKDGFYSSELVASFFDIPKPELFSVAPLTTNNIDQEKELPPKGQVKESVRYNLYAAKSVQTPQTPQKKEVQKSGDGASVDLTKGQRREEVLSVIKDRVKVTGSQFVSIKDITDKISGCSEKTIQRELIALVNDGSLKKTGERRWSTYSLGQK